MSISTKVNQKAQFMHDSFQKGPLMFDLLKCNTGDAAIHVHTIKLKELTGVILNTNVPIDMNMTFMLEVG